MIPAGQFTGAPGAGLGGLGAMHTLIMPQGTAPWPQPFDTSMPANVGPGGPGVRVNRLGGLRGVATDSPLYAGVTVLGAGLGGALLGWVAADSQQGALKGGAFAAGMTGVSTGMAAWQSQKLLGATLVVAGLGGMLWAIRSKIKRH